MDQKESFNQFCKERFLEKCINSKTVSKEKGEKVIKFLKGELSSTEYDPVFKNWISRKGFKLVDYPPLSLKDVLCLPAKEKNPNDPTILSEWRRVAFVEDFFGILTDVHCKEKGHIGTKKTLAEIFKLYTCLPRSAVDKFVQLCVVCHSNKPQTTRAPLKPIVSSGFMSRGQIDLIDMRHRPDSDYHWIGHYMDHWSKFHILFPLMHKSAQEVAINLQDRVFSVIGVPRILHSDNGREFVNSIVHSVVKEWPGDVVIVNGRPRNPKCQGLVEQGNHMVEKLLGARLYEYEGSDKPPWTCWLSQIQYQLNTTVHGTMQTTPYELVFGQPPTRSFFPGASGSNILEEDVEDLFPDNTDPPPAPVNSSDPPPAPVNSSDSPPAPVNSSDPPPAPVNSSDPPPAPVNSNVCPCKRKRVPCSTKCHGGRKCANSACADNPPKNSDNPPPTPVDSVPPPPMPVDSVPPPPSIQSDPPPMPVDSVPPPPSIKSDPPPPSIKSDPPPTPVDSVPPSAPVKSLCLDADDIRILQDGQWLSDKHMHAVQKLLKSQFPHISGLQPTVLGSTNQWDVLKSEGVQILHQTNHWVCMSTIGCPPDTAYFYDSMLYNKSRLPIPVTRDIASLLNASGDVINIKVPQSQLQEGSEDCGLFAIATATSLCYGVPPSMIFWEQRKMRSHLKRCLENMKMTPFPGWQQHQQSLTIPSVTDEPLLTTIKIKVYCSCRMPQSGQEKMAQCNKCHRWYHQRCENIPKQVFIRSKNRTIFYCKYC